MKKDKMQKSSVLQNQLCTLIKDIGYKTDALRSLWARLDGQDDPAAWIRGLGIEALLLEALTSHDRDCGLAGIAKAGP